MSIYVIDGNGMMARSLEQLLNLTARLAPGTYEITREVILGGYTVSRRRYGTITTSHSGKVILERA